MPSDKGVKKGTGQYVRWGQTAADYAGMGLTPKNTAGAGRPSSDPPNG